MIVSSQEKEFFGDEIVIAECETIGTGFLQM
jgi:hypothetical protein